MWQGRQFPWWLSYTESACNAVVAGDVGSISGSGRPPGGGPLQYSCLENSMDRGPGGLQSIRLQRVGHD